MRIVMLVLNDMTADARVSREASALAEAGHEVSVLALRAKGLPASERVGGYAIERVADYTSAGWKRPLAKLSQLRARRRALIGAATGMRPDVIHANDADTLAAGLAAARGAGCRLVYDAHELYSDMISEHGLGGSWPVQAYWKRLESDLVPRADAVVTVSDGLAGVLHERHGVEPVVVRNVPPAEPLGDKGRLRREIGLALNVSIVLYQGVLIAGRGLTNLVRAMAALPQAVLVVQGFGPEEQAMREVAAQLELGDRVRFMCRVAPGELHAYACGADIGVVIYAATTLNNRMAAPNKLWSYRMAGLPVVASDFPGLRQTVMGDGTGALFDPADPASIANAIAELLVDPKRRAEISVSSRRLAETRDNWDEEKRKLLDVYDTLAKRSTS